MIDILKLKASLNALVQGAFSISEYEYYGIEVTEGYKKPSFFMQLKVLSIERETKAVTQNEFQYTITYFQKKVDEKDAFEKYEALREIFNGKVKVGNRYITITDFDLDYTGTDLNIPQFTVTLEFKDYIEPEEITTKIESVEITPKYEI